MYVYLFSSSGNTPSTPPTPSPPLSALQAISPSPAPSLESKSQGGRGGGEISLDEVRKEVTGERRGVEQVLEAVAAIAVGTVREIVEEVMGRDLHRAH